MNINIKKYRELGYKYFSEINEEIKSGIRSDLSLDDIEKAIYLENLEIPAGLAYPKKDEIYKADVDTLVKLDLVTNQPPEKYDQKLLIPKSTEIIIYHINKVKPIAVIAKFRNKEYEREILKNITKENSNYSQSLLIINIKSIHCFFRKI